MKEQCSIFWPFDFIGDRNRCFCETEKTANNCDSRWGEKDEFPYADIANSWATELEDMKRMKEMEMELEAIRKKWMAKKFIEHGRHNHHERPEPKEISKDDVKQEYGYTEENAVLIQIASERLSRTMKALDIVIKSDKIDLDLLNKIAPMSDKKMKELLVEYYNAKINDYTEIVDEAKKYMYGEPETEPSEGGSDEGSGDDTTDQISG